MKIGSSSSSSSNSSKTAIPIRGLFAIQRILVRPIVIINKGRTVCTDRVRLYMRKPIKVGVLKDRGQSKTRGTSMGVPIRKVGV